MIMKIVAFYVFIMILLFTNKIFGLLCHFSLIGMSKDYIWFLKNLRENKKERKQKGKKIRDKKNKFKFNKLFLYISSNSFYLFFSIIVRLNNLKIYKF